MPDFANVTLGREIRIGGDILPRHRHRGAYVCVVLGGGFDEAGDAGRVHARPGDIVFHDAFDAHRDCFLSRGADTLNFALEEWSDWPAGLYRHADPDRIARVALYDVNEARGMLLAEASPVDAPARDWPDILAADISRDPNLALTRWAERHRLAPATLSRGFQRAFGLSPVAFRAQIRARRAWRSIVYSTEGLASLACVHGFADQAHMTRAVAALTGHTPSDWRRAEVK
jgi:AraC-like DNA-binding protein